jgi:putative addiction module component (TIGR02574 family)
MPRSFQEVRQIANELPIEQRILVANSLWESIVPAEDEAAVGEAVAAWDDEVNRRLKEIDSRAVELVPWEQLRAEMIESLSPQTRARLRV